MDLLTGVNVEDLLGPLKIARTMTSVAHSACIIGSFNIAHNRGERPGDRERTLI